MTAGRFRHHIEVVQIAGTPDIVGCYVVTDDIAPDFNVSVEVPMEHATVQANGGGWKDVKLAD